jgi:putative FmdB family regulatory protein
MPIFEFRCKECNHKFEELVLSAVTDLTDITCPQCGEKAAEKLMSACCVGSSGPAASSSAVPCGRSGFS